MTSVDRVAMETYWMTSSLLVLTFVNRRPPCGVQSYDEQKWKTQSCTCKLNSHYPLAPWCSFRSFGYLLIWRKAWWVFRVRSHKYRRDWGFIGWECCDFTDSPQWVIYGSLQLNLVMQTMVEEVYCSSLLGFVPLAATAIYTAQPHLLLGIAQISLWFKKNLCVFLCNKVYF